MYIFVSMESANNEIQVYFYHGSGSDTKDAVLHISRFLFLFFCRYVNIKLSQKYSLSL